jgi:pyruvate formate lyase activating enzyme
MKECILYKKEKNKKVRCLACAHKCLIINGKTGICGVRENSDGKLFLLVYGKVAAINVDPIEKKPLYHFLKESKTYSVGTVGCNFRCDFCQNFDISQVSKGKRAHIFGNEASPEEIVESAIKTGCKSISYTYNEPAIFIEFVKDCAVLARKHGLKNIIVTNGYWSRESFDFICDYIDAVNIDLKGSQKYYNKLCGGKLAPVLDTIMRCHDYGIHVEITTLIIPGENDLDEELEKIAKFIASVDKNIPWHISRFFPVYKMLSKDVTTRATLERAYKIGRKAGLKNVYLGNV